MLKKIVYSKPFKVVNKSILSLVYDKKYLSGKFFDDQRYGYVWAWKALPRAFKLKRRGITWPISKNCRVPNGKNIIFHPNSLNVFQQPGCYFQSHVGKIFIGKDVWIAQNVGIITANHDPQDPEKHLIGKDVHIDDFCWIGMNAVILPGVHLGPHTTVGAGSIVTHSFEEGNCIIAGNPARVIRKFDDGKQ